jgi:hypothetical protein
MLIPNKHSGYSRDGRRLYFISMGGGNSTPANTTQTQTQELPEWARGYAKDTLAKTSALTDVSQNPYKTYDANRIAGFSPMQQQSMTGAQNMTTAPQLDTASGIAGLAGSKAMGIGYTPGQFNAPQVGTQDYTGSNVSQYMNPYMQNVVDIQQREAQRQADIAGTQRAGQAVKSGAFGGSRAGIMEAEAARNLAMQKGDIQAAGQNAAFQNAQQQFNTQQQRDLQAQLANQGVGMQAQQLGEQSRQFGASHGLAGLNTALQAANAQGQLGGLQNQSNLSNLNAQLGAGQVQRGIEQQGLDAQRGQWEEARNNPYKMLQFQQSMLQGLPIQGQSYTIAQPNSLQAAAGGAKSLTELLKSLGYS